MIHHTKNSVPKSDDFIVGSGRGNEMAMVDTHVARAKHDDGSAILDRSRSAPHRDASHANDTSRSALEIQQRLA
jgi:hypothetical protein